MRIYLSLNVPAHGVKPAFRAEPARNPSTGPPPPPRSRSCSRPPPALTPNARG